MTDTNPSQEPQTPSRGGNQLRLDDMTLNAIVDIYPGDVRENVLWLGTYVRERCNRNLSVLEAHVRQVKHEMSYSTFYKIFTGQYFVVAQKGKQKGKMIGSATNFNQVVDALRSNFRIEDRAGKIPFIETPTWTLISDYITTRRMPERVCKFGVIIGVTGGQKSACYKEYVVRNNHGKCVHLEAPHKVTMTMFITDLAARYGCSIWSNQENKLRTIAGSVTSSRTIIVDNVQRLYDSQRGGDQPIFNYLQKLQDDTGCTVILSFTPDFEKTLTEDIDRGYFEQFVGRAGGRRNFLRLPNQTPREDVIVIAESFGFVEVGKHIKYLEKIANEKGMVRILFNDLQDAKALADEMNEPLGIKHLRTVRDEEAA